MHDEQDERDDEQHVGDVGGDSRNPGHAQDTGNYRDNEKD
jgi:hypothetical protein